MRLCLRWAPAAEARSTVRDTQLNRDAAIEVLPENLWPGRRASGTLHSRSASRKRQGVGERHPPAHGAWLDHSRPALARGIAPVIQGSGSCLPAIGRGARASATARTP